MRVIQNRFPPKPSFQLTTRRPVKGHLPIVNMSGTEQELEMVCESFVQLYKKVQENWKIREAKESAQRNIPAEIEGLNVRILELEEEINMLQMRLEELRDFCEDFDQLYSEVMKNLQDGGAAGGAAAATPDDDDDDVEELRERIRELELENRKLRKK
ncbi:hypothetical protein HF521_003520 [Silurus meridionalis]|uniref:Uncharacterized protein n=1 Tax=Silurus meridionalis TaxID=175797 RepID=A0A8T0B0T6_SILME|nr:hypothetical protein HF521_003520 [Silurus meridionalis]